MTQSIVDHHSYPYTCFVRMTLTVCNNRSFSDSDWPRNAVDSMQSMRRPCAFTALSISLHEAHVLLDTEDVERLLFPTNGVYEVILVGRRGENLTLHARQVSSRQISGAYNIGRSEDVPEMVTIFLTGLTSWASASRKVMLRCLWRVIWRIAVCGTVVSTGPQLRSAAQDIR
jgi:hypothetical protein